MSTPIKKLIITKANALKAVKEERLKPLYFYHHDLRFDRCAYCAVGAVLRQKKVANNSITLVASESLTGEITPCVPSQRSVAPAVIRRLLSEKKYLEALSTKFELECAKIYDPENWGLSSALGAENVHLTPKQEESVRKKMVTFIEKNFPEGRIAVIEVDKTHLI